ncbi:hypothetical protein SNOG_15783 [Parastagonospora nodorum SN15]|uniref:Uncharacterized protein n=1 Tax=Phaeosphaeria nodorum (strain SN15 / ATCC MYA-4574 / FGSC 10173) TaxID=321614 RepID=Q0TXM1_PHANO|nr:hypothetical protein SNOG_15783 [Parastagonospora nodorum SN15]EAT76878.1 hypothetical protein SNOG_15783 [Parastagonospora nodorum SN15]
MHLDYAFREGEIEVNYTKTPGQVMLDVAKYHVNKFYNLRFPHESIRRLPNQNGICEHDLDRSIPTWIPLTWRGRHLGGVPVKSRQRKYEASVYARTILILGTTTEAMPTKATSITTILTEAILTKAIFHERDVGERNFDSDDEELFIKCAPNCVDAETMQLRACGFRVVSIQSPLNLPDNEETMTLLKFWSSALGQHIHSFISCDTPWLPLDMIRALASIRLEIDKETIYEACVAGLTHLFEISQRPDSADRPFGFLGSTILDLLEPVRDIHEYGLRAVNNITSSLVGRMSILTDKHCFGLVPRCEIGAGDEIWMLSGCSLPSVLRQQSNGTYTHICTARIPSLMSDITGHPDIRRLAPEAAPGNQIGEWSIENIELS